MLLWIILYVVLGIIVNLTIFKQFNILTGRGRALGLVGTISKWVIWPFWIIFWLVFIVFMNWKMSQLAKAHKPKF